MDNFNSNEQHDENQTINNENYSSPQSIVTDLPVNDHLNVRQEKAKPRLEIWKVWFSGIIGGLTVAVIGFLLLYTGVIPIEQIIPVNNTVQTEVRRAPIIQTSGHGDGVPTELLSDVAGAVVGVSNLQSFG